MFGFDDKWWQVGKWVSKWTPTKWNGVNGPDALLNGCDIGKHSPLNLNASACSAGLRSVWLSFDSIHSPNPPLYAHIYACIGIHTYRRPIIRHLALIKPIKIPMILTAWQLVDWCGKLQTHTHIY